jgi:hypothetical protein
MARRKDDGWLGKRPVLWALYEAEKVPARLVSTLLAVAARAGEDGRGAFPSVAEIAAVTRKAERAVQKDLAALRKLGLLLPGDDSLAGAIRADRRPNVYDLPLPRGEPECTPLDSHGVAEKVERGRREGRHGVSHGSPEDLLNRSRRSPSPFAPADLRAELAALGAREREIDHIVSKIRNDPGIRHPIAYLRKALDNGDGPEHIAEARAALAAADAGTPVPDDWPPWCGKCDQRTRHREDDEGRPYRCPGCHPLAVKGEP